MFMFKLVLTISLCIHLSISQTTLQINTYQSQLKAIIQNIQSSIQSNVQLASNATNLFNTHLYSDSLTNQIYIHAFSDIRNNISSTIGQSAIPYYLKTWNCTSISANNYSQLITANNQLLANELTLSQLMNQLQNYSACPQADQLLNLQGLMQQEINVYQSQMKQLCINNSTNTELNLTIGNTSVSPINSQNNSSIINGSVTPSQNGSIINSNNTNTNSTILNNLNGSQTKNPSNSSSLNNSTGNGTSTPPSNSSSLSNGTGNGSSTTLLPSNSSSLSNATGNGTSTLLSNSSSLNNGSGNGTLAPPSNSSNSSSLNNVTGNGSTSTSPSNSTSLSNATSNGTSSPSSKLNNTTNNTTGNGSSATPSNPSSGIFLNNLGNSMNNWVYGNVIPQTYYSDVNNKISSGAAICPPQTPYIDSSNKCISCPQLYDISLRQCASCPSGSSLNQSIHQCDTSNGETVLKNSNPLFLNNSIGSVNKIDNLTTCPSTAPYFNGNDCISCQLPSYFDFSNSVCLTCGVGYQFDVSSKICMPLNNSVSPQYPQLNSNLSPGTNNYVGTPPNQNNQLSNCPTAQPFFNGLNCLSCSLPLYFNFSSNVCSACGINYLFDITSQTCMVDPTKIYYSNSLNGVSNYIGLPPILTNSSNKIVNSCPPEAPFSSGKVCISCSVPKFYNFNTNNCEMCGSGLTFNSTTMSCQLVTLSSSAQNSNVENASNFMYQMPQFNSSLSTCTASAPFFNGMSCVSCSLPSFFNFKTLTCTNCLPQQSFNAQNRQCVYTNQTSVTDTTNPGIYYNGNYNSLVNSIQSTTSTNPNITVCPTNSPFYDATSNQCISCPQSTPIFNIKYNQCISCGNDSYFDPNSRLCLYNQGVSLSLERTLMNTFSL